MWPRSRSPSRSKPSAGSGCGRYESQPTRAGLPRCASAAPEPSTSDPARQPRSARRFTPPVYRFGLTWIRSAMPLASCVRFTGAPTTSWSRVAGHQRRHRSVLRHDDLRRAAVVGHGQLAAARRLHHRLDGGVGHGLVVAAVERTVAGIDRLREAAHFVGDQLAVGVLHRGHAEEVARLDVGERDRLREHDLGLVPRRTWVFPSTDERIRHRTR